MSPVEQLVEKHRHWNVDGVDWWDAVYEDAKHMGALMGIEVLDIEFSGFWHQGDGCSFYGMYRYAPDAVSAIKSEAPEDKELHALAERLTLLQVESRLLGEETFSCRIGQTGRYWTMYIDFSWDLEVDLEDEFLKVFKDFASWIYKSLENEYEYLTSDEQVIEALLINGLLHQQPNGEIIVASALT